MKKKNYILFTIILVAGILIIFATNNLTFRLIQKIKDRYFPYSPFYNKYNGFGIKIPEDYTIHGIDVSHYQGKINWEMVENMKDKNIKIKFVFIKATEGITIQDSMFKRNWTNANKTKIICGAYHYFHPSVNAKKQAKSFISKVKLTKNNLPPVLDIEETNYLPDDEIVKSIRIWLNEVKKHYKVKPIIYTNIKFYRNYIEDNFSDYPLWIAHYYRGYPFNKAWKFWQHSDKGQVNGINHNVSFNVFCCDSIAFQKILIK